MARATSAGLLAVLLALGACSKDSGNGASKKAAAVEAGRRYAQCMRANGVPDFPDPDANGEFRGVGHEQSNDPSFQDAVEKCRDLAPAGQHEKFGDPIFIAQMRAYSKCMRANGVPDFPDPDPDGRLRGQGHEQQNDPNYRAAAEICRDMLPGGGHQ